MYFASEQMRPGTWEPEAGASAELCLEDGFLWSRFTLFSNGQRFLLMAFETHWLESLTSMVYVGSIH